MANTKISQDYATLPFSPWAGTDIVPGIRGSANGAGLVSSLRTYFATAVEAWNEAPTVVIASSGSVGIGAAAANTISITGTNTITAFDTIAAGARRQVVFAGVLTLTHNATSLILPTGANITTAVGDVAEFLSLGSGNWRCVGYTRANGTALAGSPFTGGTLTSSLNEAPQVTIASATTTDIGAATANYISVTGSTTITGLGTIASGARRMVTFAGALTLTYNATSLILPGAASITTAAGDTAEFVSLGSGNWRCLAYTKASGAPVVSGGLANFTEAVNTSTPNGSVPVVSLTAANAATDVDVTISPKGQGALTWQIADNSGTGGNKRGARALDFQSVRGLAAQVASGGQSLLIGCKNSVASATSTGVIGGDNGTASTTAGAYVFGANFGTATGSYAGVYSGLSNTSGGTNTVVVGGQNNNIAAGNHSGIFAGNGADTKSLDSVLAFSAGKISSVGDLQRLEIQHSGFTNTNTALALATNRANTGSAPAAATAAVLDNNSTVAFDLTVVARASVAPDHKAWKVQGVAARVANAASTTIVAVTVTSIGASGGAGTWTVTVVANTTLGSLEIQVTGASGVNTYWLATGILSAIKS